MGKYPEQYAVEFLNIAFYVFLYYYHIFTLLFSLLYYYLIVIIYYSPFLIYDFLMKISEPSQGGRLISLEISRPS